MLTLLRKSFILFTLFFSLAAIASADAPTPPTSAPSRTAASADASGNRPQLREVSAYKLSPTQMARATALYHTRLAMFFGETLFELLMFLALLHWRVGARLARRLGACSRFAAVRAILYFGAMLLLMSALGLPLELYGQHVQRVYGLSVQSWGSWAHDWALSTAISAFFLSLVLWGVYALIRRSPRRWWLWAWLCSLPVIFTLVFAAPVLIEPLFNKYQPLTQDHPALVEKIDGVMRRGGVAIPHERIFEMKASDKVTTYNAYVTGLGATKHVVVWDNTARELADEETMFIFGHEMGHYVLHHIYKGLLFTCLLFLLAFWLGGRMTQAAIHRWGGRWSLASLADWGSLPALLLAVSLLNIALTPAASAFSRYEEHEADRYGLEVMRGLTPDPGRAAASSFQKLGEKGFSYPTPNRFYVWFAYDHPPLSERIDFCLRYHPWNEGGAPKYVR